MSISLYPPTPALAMAGAAPGTTFGVDFNRLLDLPRNVPNRLLELPNYGLWQATSFLFYRPATAGCSRQTLQTLRNFKTGSWSCHETCQTGSWSCQTMGSGRPSLSFSTGPQLPDAPFKPSKRSETSKPALGAATKPAKPALGAAKLYGLWQAMSVLFYWP